MSYVLTCATVFTDGAPAERRADTALDALRAFVAYLHEDHVAPILSESGELISPARLLEEARTQAADPESRRQLTGVLADYAETAWLREVLWATSRYVVLNSDEYKADLRTFEAQSGPGVWRRETDAEERSRLRDLLEIRSTWHLAGAVWFRNFHVLPPAEVVIEVRARLTRPLADQFRLGANDERRRNGGRPPRYQVVPSPDAVSYSVVDGETHRVARRWSLYPIARAHADALNAGRPWDDRNDGRELDLWARARVERRPPRRRSTPGLTSRPIRSPIPPRGSAGRRP